MRNNDDVPPNIKEWTAFISESMDRQLSLLLNDYNMTREEFLAISLKVFSEYKNIFGIRRRDSDD